MKTMKYCMLFATFMILALSGSLSTAQEEHPEGWEDYSHGNETDPDYEVVFPQEQVNTVTLTISPENWQAMLDNMTELYGEAGTRDMMGGGPGGAFQPPEGGEMPEGFTPPNGGELPEGFEPPANGEMPEGFTPPEGMGFQGGPGGGMMLDGGENPMWVNVDVEFNGQTWTNVGMRFKGNSSLMGAWGSGIMKLGFRLDFDEFEDDYPEIDNQRFFGFKELSFSSNWNDSSFLREKVTADVFREAGIPSSQTAFYAIYVDYGEGPVYFGLYTAVEMVEDTVIETQFEDNNGNVYKPEGNGATFASGTFSEESFDKETNEEAADYSDILALYDALHAEARTTDPESWRRELESVFDVDGFIHWLAVNEVVQNWDTYGSMSHNYYLYNDPTTELLTWIPWDNNMALSEGMGIGRGPMGRDNQGQSGTTTLNDLSQENVSSDWPLIRYLMDDPVYHDLYVSYVEEVSNGAFEPAKMEATYQAMHDMIEPYVVGENGEQEGYTFLNSPEDFETALTSLIEHVNQRYATAQEYVNSQRQPEQ
jgi:spore coat protein H